MDPQTNATFTSQNFFIQDEGSPQGIPIWPVFASMALHQVLKPINEGLASCASLAAAFRYPTSSQRERATPGFISP
jgi:hypothetical protein